MEFSREPSLLPTRGVGAEKPISSGSEGNQCGWLSGAVKGFSEAFSSFTAKFKTSGSSVQSKNPSVEGASQKRTFSSLGSWSSSFSLRSWVGKINIQFFKTWSGKVDLSSVHQQMAEAEWDEAADPDSIVVAIPFTKKFFNN